MKKQKKLPSEVSVTETVVLGCRVQVSLPSSSSPGLSSDACATICQQILDVTKIFHTK